MNTKSTLPPGDRAPSFSSRRETASPTMRSRREPLSWWYRIAAPADPPTGASLAQREIARRGKLTSIILLAIMLIVVILLLVTAFGPNHALFVGLLVGLIISSVALVFNRRGKITVAGVLIVAQVIAGQTFSIISSPGGLTTNTLGLFDQYVISELVAISFLPATSVFVVAAINSIICWFLLNFLHHDAQVGQLLRTSAFSVLLRPVILLGIVAVVTYLWVRSALQALQRADRAEEIAILEQREIERQQQEIEQKHQLDLGIQQILQTHVEVANGNFRARAPLTKDNLLWQIASSLNNLLARLQRLSQVEYEMHRMRNTYESQAAQTHQHMRHLQSDLQRARQEVETLRSAKQQDKSSSPPNRTHLNPFTDVAPTGTPLPRFVRPSSTHDA